MFTDLFSYILNRNLSKRKIDFAFLVHPRGTEDIYKKYGFLRILPKSAVNFLLLFFWPTYGGTIRGMERDGQKIKGALIIVPLTGRQMLSKRKLAKRKVLAAVKLARTYGAEVVGLGALTSTVTSGGEDIRQFVHPVHLTSGNSLTAFRTFDDVREVIVRDGLKGPIAVVGATGSIGKAVTLMLAETLKNELIIVGKNPERTQNIGATIEADKSRFISEKVLCSVNIQDISRAETIIVTTSASGAVINEDTVKSAKLIYDVTQPKNTPENIQSSEALTFIDGGLIKLPEHLSISLDIGLPKGVAFSCLSETMLISASERLDLVSKSNLEIENIKQVGELAKKYNFVSHLIYGRSN